MDEGCWYRFPRPFGTEVLCIRPTSDAVASASMVHIQLECLSVAAQVFIGFNREVLYEFEDMVELHRYNGDFQRETTYKVPITKQIYIGCHLHGLSNFVEEGSGTCRVKYTLAGQVHTCESY